MSNLNQQLGLNVQAFIDNINVLLTAAEADEINITPVLTYTDSAFFQYGIRIMVIKVLQDQANAAVATYTLTPSEASQIAGLQTRLTTVENIYIGAMIIRAPTLFT